MFGYSHVTVFACLRTCVCAVRSYALAVGPDVLPKVLGFSVVVIASVRRWLRTEVFATRRREGMVKVLVMVRCWSLCGGKLLWALSGRGCASLATDISTRAVRRACAAVG